MKHYLEMKNVKNMATVKYFEVMFGKFYWVHISWFSSSGNDTSIMISINMEKKCVRCFYKISLTVYVPIFTLRGRQFQIYGSINTVRIWIMSIYSCI